MQKTCKLKLHANVRFLNPVKTHTSRQHSAPNLRRGTAAGPSETTPNDILPVLFLV